MTLFEKQRNEGVFSSRFSLSQVVNQLDLLRAQQPSLRESPRNKSMLPVSVGRVLSNKLADSGNSGKKVP